MYEKVKQASLQALLLGPAEQCSPQEGDIGGEPRPRPDYCQRVTRAAMTWSPLVEKILLVKSNILPAFPKARHCFPLPSQSRQGSELHSSGVWLRQCRYPLSSCDVAFVAPPHLLNTLFAVCECLAGVVSQNITFTAFLAFKVPT